MLNPPDAPGPRRCLFDPPADIEAAVRRFRAGARLLADGWVDDAVAVFRTIPDDEYREHFDRVAGAGGIGSVEQRRIQAQMPSAVPKDQQDPCRNWTHTSYRSHYAATLQRDAWRCRWCDAPVIHAGVLAATRKRLREIGALDVLRAGSVGSTRNIDVPGIEHVARAWADHVVPHSHGGRTSVENIVTSCGPCNYGRGSMPIELLGIAHPNDPARGAITADDWDGASTVSFATEAR